MGHFSLGDSSINDGLRNLLLSFKKCPEIDASRRYWFIRTDGGRLYDAFKVGGIIGIGYPKININELIACDFSVDAQCDSLKNRISDAYPDHKRPGLVVSQLKRFTKDLKYGDLVVIPSESSNRILIGDVVDDELYEMDLYVNIGSESCLESEFKKFRKVRWIKEVSKKDYNPHLFQLMNSHQAIYSADDYSQWIDQLLFDFFKKDNYYHLVLNIGSRNEITAQDLFRVCLDLLDFSEVIVNSVIEEDAYNIVAKVNINSPGDIELIAATPFILGIIALVVLFVNGGHFVAKLDKYNFEVSLGTDGLISRIKDFLDSNEDRKLKKSVREKIGGLEIKDSRDLIGILQAINKEGRDEKC